MPSPTLAQMGDNDSEEFVEQGNQEMEQDVETLENEQSQELTEQQKEEKLEQELNIQQRNPQSPEIEDVPAPGVGDNVPTPPPDGEAEIKIP
ncbi:hypothetical protein VB715_02040 [Crocosphaera sp. UHCC 0190]|uniref:hypothetical protein n=1 Tax=Crocosphaera sp. UHCC 0190 TaxID=3110246 RepID=UPI002B214116|nr:hypothetical protein [Crocosphaera sp. UHCC 0190]MEA5508536.1 hypothetical protein [Crocosphaera sp. UHCC 0190]